MKAFQNILGKLVIAGGVLFAAIPIFIVLIPPNPPGEIISLMAFIFTIPIGILIGGIGSMISNHSKTGEIQVKKSIPAFVWIVLVIIVAYAIVLFQPFS